MKEAEKKPIRVLHVVNKFDAGGVETWLLNVTSRLPAKDCRFDFFTISQEDARLDNEFLSLGCHVFKGSREKPSVISVFEDLRQIVSRKGPYDAIHSHVHHFSGVVLLMAFLLGIPVRIAHSHNDTRSKECGAGVPRHLYVALMRFCVWLFASRGIGVSSLAAEDQFGLHWKRDERWMLLPCGIDFSLFHIPGNVAMKSDFGIPDIVRVVGHVGRFDEQKNHYFLLKVFSRLIEQGEDARLLLVGEGPLLEAVKQRASALRLTDKVIFLGVRKDVPEILKSVVDVFVFPSLYEGLGLALVEAQLAGCFCLASSQLPQEVVVAAERVALLDLNASLDIWVQKIRSFFRRSEETGACPSILTQEKSVYDLSVQIPILLDLYKESKSVNK